MVVKIFKKFISINCDPIVPVAFKYKLIEKLADSYTLKADGNDDFELSEKSIITEEEKEEYLKLYKQDKFKYSFEEFLELHLFPIGTLELISKENNEKIALVDFMPDGDVNMIRIDVYNLENKDKLLYLINNLMGELETIVNECAERKFLYEQSKWTIAKKIIKEIIGLIFVYIFVTIYGYYNGPEPKYSWLISAIMLIIIYPLIKLAINKGNKK